MPRKDEYSTCVKPVWANYTFPARLGYRLIDRCPSDTADSSLREQCEYEVEDIWRIDCLPVVDVVTGLRFVITLWFLRTDISAFKGTCVETIN